MSATYIVGDSLSVLRSMPDASVDLVLTSPPFLALRSYLPADHADKALEMGSEPTPAAFIDALLDIVEECRRVLAPHGSLCFELGDTYSGSGGAGGDYGWDRLGDRSDQDGQPPNYRRKGQVFDGSKRQANNSDGWPMDKSLTMIPESFRWALAYGRNPFNGRITPRWRIRNVVRWCRPNPPVGALGDKVRPATSDMVIACMARDRYFDLDAVRHVGVEPGAVKRKTKDHSGANPRSGWESDNTEIHQNPAGAPPLDHWWHDDTFDQDAWNIPTQPFSGAHYATWPEKLLITPIKSMCPLKVCRQCGEPSRRIVGEPEYVKSRGDGEPNLSNGHHGPPGVNRKRSDIGDNGVTRLSTTLGWTDCGHDDWRTGVALDPFAGSGTTLAVATGHGRDAIGIDIDDRNADLAIDRVGPLYMTVEHHAAKGAA